MAHFMHMVIEGFERWPNSPLIRPFIGTTTEFSWGIITFQDFHRDLQKTAAYWQGVLTAAGIRPGAVVGLW